MDVLLVHNILWSHYKGAVFTELHKQAASAGISINFVHITRTEKARIALAEVDTNVHQYPHVVLFAKPYEAVSSIRKAYALIKKLVATRPKVIVVPGYYDVAFWLFMIVAWMLGCQIVLAFDSQRSDKRRRWATELPKRLFIRFCDVAFTYGTKSRQYLESLGMPADRIFVRVQAAMNTEISQLHQNALARRDEGQKSLRLREHNFVFVGRLSREKNLISLLHAYDKAISCVPPESQWGLLVIGDGTMHSELKALATSRRLSHVSFVGGKGWREIPAFLALADVLVLPSLSEPWGLVINEAMACGMPVVASDRCGAAHDLVHVGKNGYVFTATSEIELELHLRTIMQQPIEVIQEMGKHSRKLIEDFTPHKAAQQMMIGFHLLLGLTNDTRA